MRTTLVLTVFSLGAFVSADPASRQGSASTEGLRRVQQVDRQALRHAEQTEALRRVGPTDPEGIRRLGPGVPTSLRRPGPAVPEDPVRPAAPIPQQPTLPEGTRLHQAGIIRELDREILRRAGAPILLRSVHDKNVERVDCSVDKPSKICIAGAAYGPSQVDETTFVPPNVRPPPMRIQPHRLQTRDAPKENSVEKDGASKE